MLLKRIGFALILAVGMVSMTATAQEKSYESDSAFEAWCADGTRTLRRAQQVSDQQVSQGQFSAAAATLLRALKSGVARPSWSIKPVTWKLMVHGADMGTAMINAGGSDIRAVKATVNTLQAVYDLIFVSANEIDRPYYRTNCGYCRGQGLQAFENRVLRMSGDLLNLVNANMTISRNRQVFPLGPAASYLVGAEVAATGALIEISELLQADAYACELMDLESISADLADFNRSTSTERDRAGMFYDTFSRLAEVIEQLRGGYGCNRRY